MIVCHISEKHDVFGGRPQGHLSIRKLKPGVDTGWLGNPYAMRNESYAERVRVIELFRAYFHQRVATDLDFREAVLALKGKRVACFCHRSSGTGSKCHLDVVAEFVNATAASGG